MSEVVLYRLALGIGALFFVVFAVWTFRLRPENVARFEPWPRHRLSGMIIGWIALVVCVPHAAVVSPEFLVPLLWPLALAVPVLGYFYVDYPLARAAGGAAILGAYYLVHKSFELHTPGAPFLAVLAWLFGIAGIWVSGKPCSLRDWIRLCARSQTWRTAFAGFWGVMALALGWGAIFTGNGGL